MKNTVFAAISASFLAVLLAGCATRNPAPDAAADEVAKSDAPKANATKADAVKPSPPMKPQQRVDAFLKSLGASKTSYSNRIEKVSALLAEPDFATNAANAAYVRLKILDLCLTPGWTSITLWDPGLAKVHMEPTARAILDAKGVPAGTQTAAAAKYARYLAGEKRYNEAEKVARDMIARGAGFRNPLDRINTYFILADVFRWQDRYDDAMAVLKEAMPLQPASVAPKASGLARDFGHADELPAIWRAANAPLAEFEYYADYKVHGNSVADTLPGYADARRRARDYVLCATNPPLQRFRVASKFFLNAHDDDANKAVASLRGADFSGLSPSWPDTKVVTDIFASGDYPRFAEMSDIFGAAPLMNTEPLRLACVVSLGASGRAKDGAALAAEFAKDETTFSPINRAVLRIAAAVLSGKSPDGIAETADLPVKERAGVFAIAAGLCQTWGRVDLAERFAAQHTALFKPRPERIYDVPFTDTPIDSAEDWRRLWPRLEKQYCDIKYQGSLDFMETDVATGVRREVNMDSEGKPFSFMEMTAACDVRGLHVFLRLETDQARAIERGFGKTGTCEVYFAPGRNQPYTCLGLEPRGVTYSFHTTYENANHRRLDLSGKKPQSSFHSDTWFSDSDYTLHLFFAWDNYPEKLPAVGDEWRFECLSFQPFGRYTWGGSQGVHSASAWGSLRFGLSPTQLTAIRRRLLFSTFRGYKAFPFPFTSLNIFEYWKDSATGDPAFYEKCLAPLEKELAEYAARVKEDMTDEEVNEVYSRGLVRWVRLRDIIEGLHRRYLAEKFTD